MNLEMSDTQFEKIISSLSTLSEENKGILRRLDSLNGQVAKHTADLAELRINDIKMGGELTQLTTFKNGVWATIAKVGLPFITAIIGAVLAKMGVINFNI